MNIVKLTNNNQAAIINKAAGTISNGGIIIAPFDTVYGFLCDAHNDRAIEKINYLKNRDTTAKTIGIAVANYESICTIADTRMHESYLRDRIPGRFSFVLPINNQNFISRYCIRDNSVSVRVPDSDLIIKIINALPGHIAAQTSANRSGQGSACALDEVLVQFEESQLNQIDLLIDGEKIENCGPSQIIDLTSNVPKPIERM